MTKTARGFDDGDDDDEVSECPDCGAEVYRIADCCPKCGYWFVDDDDVEAPGRRRSSSFSPIVKITSLILIAAMIISLVLAGVATLGG